MDSVRDTACAVGCPIRRSRDQRSLASPPGFSQRATSFIASWRQGIHQMPLPQRLIAKPVARRDKPRSDDRGQTTEDGMSAASASRRREQRVSHEDTLRKLSADNRQLKASLTPSSLCQRPSRRHPCRQNLLLPIHPRPDWPANRSGAEAPWSSYAMAGFGGQPPLLARPRLVEVNGIEPMTSCLQSRRSPN
jgi:hypothetical protein